MELILKSRTRRVRRPVIQDHYWYDHISKEMFHEKGGRLEFVYDPVKKRSVPKVVDHEDWVQENDHQDIKDWLDKNKNSFSIDITYDDGRNITTTVPAMNISSLLGVLYRAGIMTDYDEKELKKELRGR